MSLLCSLIPLEQTKQALGSMPYELSPNEKQALYPIHLLQVRERIFYSNAVALTANIHGCPPKSAFTH